MSLEASISELAAAIREIAAALREPVPESEQPSVDPAAPPKRGRGRPRLPPLPPITDEMMKAAVDAKYGTGTLSETLPVVEVTEISSDAAGASAQMAATHAAIFVPDVTPAPATKEQVSALVVHLVSKLQQRPKAVEILAAFGAKNIHELDPAKYTAAAMAFEAAIKAATPA